MLNNIIKIKIASVDFQLILLLDADQNHHCLGLHCGGSISLSYHQAEWLQSAATTTGTLSAAAAHRPSLKAGFKVFGLFWCLWFRKPLLDSVLNKGVSHTLRRFHSKYKALLPGYATTGPYP